MRLSELNCGYGPVVIGDEAAIDGATDHRVEKPF
jgi:NADH:ubiquinone oxidoreductase subunit E